MKKLLNISICITLLVSLLVPSFSVFASVTSGTCGDNITYVLDESTGILSIDGTGEMNPDKDYISKEDIEYKAGGNTFSVSAALPTWHEFKDQIKKVVISKGVTTVCTAAFYEFPNLTSVSIPTSVEIIEPLVFKGCSNLEKVSMSSKGSIRNIELGAFSGCSKITKLTISASLINVEDYAFYGCDNLKYIDYSGSDYEWKNVIDIGVGNSKFKKCNVVYECDKFTSSGLMYEDLFDVTLNKYTHLSNKYNYSEKRSIQIPGIKQTSTYNFDNRFAANCKNMIPQGVCFAGDNKEYMLVSAYCSGNCTYLHDSVVYVLSTQTKELLSTIVIMDCSSHVGGITFDGKRVWIGSSNTVAFFNFSNVKPYIGKKDKIKVNLGKTSRLKINGRYRSYVKSVRSSKRKTYYIKTNNAIKLGNPASFLTYYNGYLVVGAYNSSGSSSVRFYKLSSTSTTLSLSLKYRMSVPRRTQGIEIYKYAGKTYALFSISGTNIKKDRTTSKNRKLHSDLQINEIKWKGLNTTSIKKKVYSYPNMSEDLCIKDGYLYTCYESASNYYYGSASDKATYVTDRVTASNLKCLMAPIVNKPSIKKAKLKDGELSVKWSKTCYSGYELQIARDEKFTKEKQSVKIEDINKLGKKFKKLKKDKTYYVRIRSYKIYKDKTYYSSWTKQEVSSEKKTN